MKHYPDITTELPISGSVFGPNRDQNIPRLVTPIEFAGNSRRVLWHVEDSTEHHPINETVAHDDIDVFIVNASRFVITAIAHLPIMEEKRNRITRGFLDNWRVGDNISPRGVSSTAIDYIYGVSSGSEWVEPIPALQVMQREEEVQGKLEEVGQLQRGWDGDDAQPIGQDVLVYAAAFLREHRRGGVVKTHVVPVPDGTVQFEWLTEELELEVKVEAEGGGRLLVFADWVKTGDMEEFIVGGTDEEGRLKALLSKV